MSSEAVLRSLKQDLHGCSQTSNYCASNWYDDDGGHDMRSTVIVGTQCIRILTSK